MVAVNSEMLELGTQAPDFSLLDTATGEVVSRQDMAGKPLMVAFISAHCPFVINLQEALGKFSADYEGKLGMISICANDVENYPDDKPEMLAAQAAEFGFRMPYLYDESQEVAKAYSAACTPDLFLFDADHKLVYRGQFDGSRPGNGVVPDGADLRAASDALLAGEAVPSDQVPSMGCNIKWKAGNEPSYFG